MNNEEKILTMLQKIQKDMATMQEDISLIKVQQKEHGDILSSLVKASEFHKSDIDKLNMGVSRLSQEMKAEFSKINERLVNIEDDNKSLQEITGEHETAIRSMRRKIV